MLRVFETHIGPGLTAVQASVNTVTVTHVAAADILTGTDVQYVLIEQLKIDVDAQHPDQTAYQLVLAESPPPPPPGGLLDGIDTGLLDQAGGFLDSVTGALDALDALGSIPDLGDPTQPLTGMLDEVENTMGQLNDVTSVITDLFGAS